MNDTTKNRTKKILIYLLYAVLSCFYFFLGYGFVGSMMGIGQGD